MARSATISVFQSHVFRHEVNEVLHHFWRVEGFFKPWYNTFGTLCELPHQVPQS